MWQSLHNYMIFIKRSTHIHTNNPNLLELKDDIDDDEWLMTRILMAMMMMIDDDDVTWNYSNGRVGFTGKIQGKRVLTGNSRRRRASTCRRGTSRRGSWHCRAARTVRSNWRWARWGRTGASTSCARCSSAAASNTTSSSSPILYKYTDAVIYIYSQPRINRWYDNHNKYNHTYKKHNSSNSDSNNDNHHHNLTIIILITPSISNKQTNKQTQSTIGEKTSRITFRRGRRGDFILQNILATEALDHRVGAIRHQSMREQHVSTRLASEPNKT